MINSVIACLFLLYFGLSYLLLMRQPLFLWSAASGAGHRVCASKRKVKGLRGAERKPRRCCSGKKGKFRLRVCASKRRTKGLRGAERKPWRRCSGKKGKLRLRVCASKRKIKGLRGTERKPRRQEKAAAFR